MVAVSVIVPVYGVEQWVRDCLDSLIDQTFGDYEVIAINDASPDGSLAVLREYEARYPGVVSVIDSPVNRGSGGARNLGLEAARGKYVSFVDPDDWLDPTALEKLLEAATSMDADIVECDMFVFSGDEEPLGIETGLPDWIAGEATGRKRDLRVTQSGQGVLRKVIRRELFVRYDVQFPERIASQDKVVHFIYCVADYVGRVKEPLYYSRRNNTSITRTRNAAHLLDGQRAAHVVADMFRKHGLDGKHSEALDQFFVQTYYAKPLANMVLKFDRPDWRLCRAMQRYVRANYPLYRDNPYFSQTPRSQRILMYMNDRSPIVLAICAPIIQRLLGWRERGKAVTNSNRSSPLGGDICSAPFATRRDRPRRGSVRSAVYLLTRRNTDEHAG